MVINTTRLVEIDSESRFSGWIVKLEEKVALMAGNSRPRVRTRQLLAGLMYQTILCLLFLYRLWGLRTFQFEQHLLDR